MGIYRDISQLSENQVGPALRMTGFEAQVCRCGKGSEWLSNLSYHDPPIASGSGASFPSGRKSSPILVPPLNTQVPATEVPVPSLGSSSSDKENSSVRFFQSGQQAVNELVDIVEADLEVDEEEAQGLSDAMDAEVRSWLF